MWDQKKAIKKLTDRELVLNVYITQGIILTIAFILAFFLFDSREAFFSLWKWDIFDVLVIGGGMGLCIVAVDALITYIFPEDWLDDGGINERIFRSISIWELVLLTALIAFAEELLFRGVIQTAIGLVAASIIFAVLHIRYIGKIVLFIHVVTVSFVLGYVYQVTSNLLVTWVTHFTIDFLIGLWIMLENKKRGKVM